MIRRFLSRAPLLVVLVVGCGDGDESLGGDGAAPPLPSFDTSRVAVVTAGDTLPLRVELAETDEQRALGLMERPRLPEDAGMLFVYDEPQPPDAGFWMFRTRIPLDIAFLDEAGQIVAIRSMQPCTSPEPRWCPTYAPGAPYTAALEVNAGWFERHDVSLGDRVLHLREPTRP